MVQLKPIEDDGHRAAQNFVLRDLPFQRDLPLCPKKIRAESDYIPRKWGSNPPPSDGVRTSQPSGLLIDSIL